MNTLTLGNFSLTWTDQATGQYSRKLQDNFYVDERQLPHCFIAQTSMTFQEFYQADCPHLTAADYQLRDSFLNVRQRFPHPNLNSLAWQNAEQQYLFNHIPIYMRTEEILLVLRQPERYPQAAAALASAENWTAVSTTELASSRTYKLKRLFLDGRFGPRELLWPQHRQNCQMIQNKLTYFSELYYFGHYRYAAMIAFLPEYQVTTYEQFHEAYGQFIYSFTICKNGTTIPLLWPDYLYHQPENHLEFGILALPHLKRYAPFDSWQPAEEITIEILAEGFEDVQFTTSLKKMLTLPPQLSQSVYDLATAIQLDCDHQLLQELQDHTATFEIIAEQQVIPAGDLTFQTTSEQLVISGGQLPAPGRYQLKITSQNYGQMLLFFALKND